MPNLKTYRKKRDFSKTPEPPPSSGKPKRGKAGAPTYMIHKHDATRLHYDLRLEMDGALASWAIPKGPSEDPAVKRLAVQTEDHPLEYGKFEGRIPDGEYGGGDSLIWDRGVYDTLPPGEASQQRKAGRLEVVFQGEKLRGHYHLIRTRQGPSGKAQWLFFKAKDDFAKQGADLTVERPESVISGRRVTRGPEFKKILHAQHPEPEKLITNVSPPMLATLGEGLPADQEEWSFELKYDGFRALAGLSSPGASAEGTGVRVALRSRNDLDLGGRFPSIVEALGQLVVGEAVLDGEVAALDSKGVPRFALLQEGASPLVYFAFDLLWHDGQDLRARPLEERRDLLQSLLDNAPPEIQRSVEIDDPARFLAHAAARGFEGVVAKRRGSRYEARRSAHWLKIKVRNEQELAIVGYIPSTAGKGQIGSLALAYAEKGKLRFAGKVGTGFTTKVRAELFDALSPDRSPTATAEGAPRVSWLKQVVWVKPKLVAQVIFANWTSDDFVRQASYQGLRPDKKPLDATRERVR